MNKRIKLEETNNSNGQISSQGRQESDENRVADIMNEVFQINLIRETIIGHVIRNAPPEELGALRLVQKTWLRDVSKLLLKSRKPLYVLNLNKDNSLNSSDYVRENQQKILDRFISTVLSPSRIENSTPPFFLSIQEEFFRDENHSSFVNFVTGGGTAGLVDLSMRIPRNGGSMDFVFPKKSLSFPVLSELKIEFSENEIDLESNAVHGSNTYFVPFLQSILHGASRLETFALSCDSDDVLPNGIRYLTLPASLTTLFFDCSLTNLQLDGLATNSLPNLKRLSLIINNTPLSNGLLYRILEQYRLTLQKLCFRGVVYEEEHIPRDATYFSFPVMESLTDFASSSIHAELETHLLSSLHTCLPKLETLLVKNQTVEMFRKWTDGLCFPTVTQLNVGLVDENFCADSEHHYLTFRLEEMQLVHMAFPNVTILDLNVTGEETCGLKYLFTEMRQITDLGITVRNSFQHTDSHHWDSLLTGVPLHVLEVVRSNPQLLEYLSVDIKHKDASPSIRNLTVLRELDLRSDFRRGADGEERRSLISDSVFNMAFLKMSKLQTLVLFGRFSVSAEMRRLWKSEQRSIYCS